jgi:hypothetical protein
MATLIDLTKLESKKVSIFGTMPSNKFCLLDGRADTGKSQLDLYPAARYYTRTAILHRGCGTTASTRKHDNRPAEDDVEDTLLPRLNDPVADLSRVILLKRTWATEDAGSNTTANGAAPVLTNDWVSICPLKTGGSSHRWPRAIETTIVSSTS